MSDRDRDDPPGITMIPHQKMPSQITNHHIESMAMHSRSRGWLPAVRIEIVTEDGAGAVGSMLVDDVLTFVEVLLAAAERAPLDLAEAVRKGVLP